MTLIVANLLDNGILLSSDKRGKGTHRDSGEIAINADILNKSFVIGDLVWGIAGNEVDHPGIINNYIKTHLHLDELESLEEITQEIAELCLEHHLIAEYKDANFDILVARYEKGTPAIYKAVYLGDNEFKITNEGSYGSIGKHEHADDILGSLPKMSHIEMLEKHKEAFEQTSKADMTVSSDHANTHISMNKSHRTSF